MNEHGVPTMDELIEAVEECLRTEVLPATSGRSQYLVRVCAAALAQIARERALGDAHDAAHEQRLATLGVADDAALADEIRAGVDEVRRAEIVAALRGRIVDQLSVVDPRSAASAFQ